MTSALAWLREIEVRVRDDACARSKSYLLVSRMHELSKPSYTSSSAYSRSHARALQESVSQTLLVLGRQSHAYHQPDAHAHAPPPQKK
jgi:hypothetical protein